MAEGMATAGPLLFGRRTYEDFFKVWPARKDNPYTDLLNNTRKFVVSTTLREPLPWQHSTLVTGDLESAIRQLNRAHKRDIVVLGSGVLVRALIQRNLVDAFVLQIHPLLLGSGQRLFADQTSRSNLRLVKSVPTTTGVVIATYEAVSADDLSA
jgi:dihydrofolate reductase